MLEREIAKKAFADAKVRHLLSDGRSHRFHFSAREYCCLRHDYVGQTSLSVLPSLQISELQAGMPVLLELPCRNCAGNTDERVVGRLRRVGSAGAFIEFGKPFQRQG